MKYIDAEKIRAEIEKNTPNHLMLMVYRDHILALIDSLQQKPTEWSEDFDKEVENVHKRYPEVSFAKLTRIAYHFSKWANSYKGMEWSEEDEKIIQSLILEVNKYVFFAGIEANKIVSFLKSLRPSWKPTEEQMEALQNALTPGKEFDCDMLAELYEQLKKLYP